MTSSITTFGNYPYYDDFDANKNFHRILFKPGVSVQTRELNQLQSILQEQIASVADFSIADKAAVQGGKINVNNSVNYIKLADGTTLSRSPEEYNNSVEFATSNGIKGKINFIAVFEDAPITLYVTYTSAAETENTSLPKSADSITLIFEDGNTEIVQVAQSGEVTGLGTVAELEDSIYYIKKSLVRVPKQVLVLEKYNSEDLQKFNVGVLIREQVVTATEDSSLYDNALGSPNQNAPGADRYKISGLLADKSTVPDELLENFIEIVKIEHSVEATKVAEVAPTPQSEIPKILEILARRTYDESGDYVVDTFDLDIREHLQNIHNETGVYRLEDGGDESKLVAQLDPGVAYVKGYEARIPNITYLDVDKARDTAVRENAYSNPNFDNYVIVNGVTGSLQCGDIVLLQNSGRETLGRAAVIGIESAGMNRLKIYATVINGQGSKVNVAHIKGIGANSAVVDFDSNVVEYKLDNGHYPLITSLPYGYAKTTRLNNCSLYKTYNTTVTSNGKIAISNEDPTEVFSTKTSDYYVYIKNVGTGNPLSISVVQPALTQAELTVSNIGTVTSSTQVQVVAKVNIRNPQVKTKTLRTRTETVTGSKLNNKIGHLAKADGYRLISVSYTQDGNTYKATSKFNFDGGQRDTHYQNASIVVKPGVKVRTDVNYTVKYEYYEHSTTGDFFTVDSYSTADYTKIPTYVSASGSNIFLGAAFDYRPVVILNSVNELATTMNKSSRGFVAVDEEITSDITYYLPRRDRIMVTSAGVIQIVKGISSFSPELPPELDDAITLYNLTILPYTFNINDVITEKLNYKRYTMKDIGRLEARISTVEEIALLNKLESDTAKVNFADRFKSGYVVDNFAESNTGDIESAHWGVAYDLENPACRPKIISEFVDLTPQLQSMQGLKYHEKKGIITLNYTPEPYITQHLATDVVLIQPYMVYGWGQGTMTIKPSMDIWKESYHHTENLYSSTVNTLDDIVIKTTKRVNNAFDPDAKSTDTSKRFRHAIHR